MGSGGWASMATSNPEGEVLVPPKFSFFEALSPEGEVVASVQMRETTAREKAVDPMNPFAWRTTEAVTIPPGCRLRFSRDSRL